MVRRRERKYIEEVGAMNIFSRLTASCDSTVKWKYIASVTRASVIDLCKHWNIPVEERQITIQEIYDAYQAGELEEILELELSAVISPVGTLRWEDKIMTINDGKIEYSQ